MMALLGFLGLSALVWAAGGALTAAGLPGWYPSLRAPPGTPPDWLFGPVWTVLYALIGVSAWLVWRDVMVAAHRKRGALRAWGWQLLLNALWTPFFFGLHMPGPALVCIAALLVAIVVTIVQFWRLRRGAALMLVPYLAWTCYASYLNAGFWWLNN